VALVGYSMGGNLVLKLAGEWGSEPPLCAVAAVCPAIDLAAGADALHEPVNRAYEWKFLRGLRRATHARPSCFRQFVPAAEIGPVRSIREFDHKIVARYCGFRDADDYYYRAASARVVDRIAVPTLILHAQDDPFIRMLPETRAKLLANPHITLVETRHGGHCAYLSRDPGNEIHWAEATVIRFVQWPINRMEIRRMEADWEFEVGGNAPAVGGTRRLLTLSGPASSTCASTRNLPGCWPRRASSPRWPRPWRSLIPVPRLSGRQSATTGRNCSQENSTPMNLTRRPAPQRMAQAVTSTFYPKKTASGLVHIWPKQFANAFAAHSVLFRCGAAGWISLSAGP
jgi:hypothetical protein